MDDEIDDLGIIERQKLFAQDLTGHPAEALIASTVRIEGKQSNNKISVGTGFMYDFLFRKIAENRYWSITAIVTNKHVVKDTVSGNFFINQMNEQKNCMFGKKLEFNFQKYRDSWIEHPDNNVDLCILPIGSQIDKLNKNSMFPFIVHNTIEITPSEAEWNLLNPLEDIVMIGYPNGLWDEVNNTPIARRGITATHPKLNYYNERDTSIVVGMSYLIQRLWSSLHIAEWNLRLG